MIGQQIYCSCNRVYAVSSWLGWKPIYGVRFSVEVEVDSNFVSKGLKSQVTELSIGFAIAVALAASQFLNHQYLGTYLPSLLTFLLIYCKCSFLKLYPPTSFSQNC